MKNKLGVIVPFRNRSQHLAKFLPAITKQLVEQKISYEIIIVNQADDKPFNRGKLLNIGFEKAKELECDYVVFHDVDMIPIEVEYSYSNKPVHLASNIFKESGERIEMFEEYFGGITMFPVDIVEKINGYSNGYWGWGFEDDDLLFRCINNNIKLKTKSIHTPIANTAGYSFNGHDSRIALPKDFSLKDYTIFISTQPRYINCDPTADTDEYSIFTIPGFDTSLSYNSFRRFKFETWTTSKKMVVVNSDIQPELNTLITITHRAYDKQLKLYINGKLVDKASYTGRLMGYNNQDYIYLGQPSAEDNKKRPFRGTIDYFAIWQHTLTESEIEIITDNMLLGLNENFLGYESAHSLTMCYDMKTGSNKEVLDLSSKHRIAQVIHCDKEVTGKKLSNSKIKIPISRDSKVLHLEHHNNGFHKNKWRHDFTRKNQLRFYNQVKKGIIKTTKDGLSNLNYNLLEDVVIEPKINKLNVEL